ncbi:hypothetical protein ACFLWX_01620 [Chloroflexota bacterium]
METEKPDNLHYSLDLSDYRENWTSRDGRQVLLRSITSEDKRIEKELIDGLSLQSSRYRFFHVVKDATEEMVNQFCDIDYKSEVAIIASMRLGIGVIVDLAFVGHKPNRATKKPPPVTLLSHFESRNRK